MFLIPEVGLCLILLNVVSYVSWYHIHNKTGGCKCHTRTQRLPYAAPCDHVCSKYIAKALPQTPAVTAFMRSKVVQAGKAPMTLWTLVFMMDHKARDTRHCALQKHKYRFWDCIYIFQNKEQAPICSIYLRYKTSTYFMKLLHYIAL